MKLALITFSITMAICHGVAAACSIENVQNVQIGDYQGIKGRCSNNGLPISCIFIEDEGITCD